MQTYNLGNYIHVYIKIPKNVFNESKRLKRTKTHRTDDASKIQNLNLNHKANLT